MILLLVAASNFYGAVFARLGSATMIAETLLAFDLSPTMLLLLILGLIFLLGWPLEWVPIVLIVIPILLPAILKLGVDLVWFCTLVAVCLQTAWLSPPVALSAYYIKGVVPDWDLKDIYLGMMQFMGIQVLGLLVVLFYPGIALWLPICSFEAGDEATCSAPQLRLLSPRTDARLPVNHDTPPATWTGRRLLSYPFAARRLNPSRVCGSLRFRMRDATTVRRICAGAAADGEHPGVARHALQRQVARVAARPEALERVVGDLDRHLRGEDLGLGGQSYVREGAALAAALWIMSRAAAIRMLMSASIHCSPWNSASGRPNCSRSPTYARARR